MKIEFTDFERASYFEVLRRVISDYPSFKDMPINRQSKLLRLEYSKYYMEINTEQAASIINPTDTIMLDTFFRTCILHFKYSQSKLELEFKTQNLQNESVAKKGSASPYTPLNGFAYAQMITRNQVSVRGDKVDFSIIESALNQVNQIITRYMCTSTDWVSEARNYVNKHCGPMEQALFSWIVI